MNYSALIISTNADFSLNIKNKKSLHPKYYERILGKTATKDLEFGTLLTLKDFE